uniref:Protein kinase domain-containing protein n=1 Tax=Leptocylindrus danicus TaxID=163516 RepID=A0A7S2PLX6_9STRA|mmetsp:Transcript_4999/g.7327  ORF Transcript_4999/g.7327 Transcript_4999/m.7327 type:complete len:806 (+) Transcript_4999:26-2443(+)
MVLHVYKQRTISEDKIITMDAGCCDAAMKHERYPQHTIASSHDHGDNGNKQARVMVAGYVLEAKLGSGSFATVYRGRKTTTDHDGDYDNDNHGRFFHPKQFNRPGRSTAAIKAMSIDEHKLTKNVLRSLNSEIRFLREVQCETIVELYDVVKTDTRIFLVLEYCGGGDLQRLIRSRKSGRLSEGLSRRLMRDLAHGLAFLSSKQMIHRDIKPQNLLLTGPLPPDEVHDPSKSTKEEELRRQRGCSHTFRLKIADFGFARHLNKTSLADTLCGSPLYMAPEILKYQRYDAKADLWSTGVVLFEMITGKPPFNGDNHLQLLNHIQSKVVRLPADVKVSSECVDLMRILLHRNPKQRADFQQFHEASRAFVELGCLGKSLSGAASRVRPSAATVRTDEEDDDSSYSSKPQGGFSNCTKRDRPHQQQHSTNSPTTSEVTGIKDKCSSNDNLQERISILPHPVAITPPLKQSAQTQSQTQASVQMQLYQDACTPQPKSNVPLPMNITPESSREDTTEETAAASQTTTATPRSSVAMSLQNSSSSSCRVTAYHVNAFCKQAERQLMEAETLGRRAVNVAQVGDARAHLAMQQRHALANDESMRDSEATCISVDDNGNTCAPAGGGCEESSSSLSAGGNEIILFSKLGKLYEALSCYLKALELMRIAIQAVQEVMNESASSAVKLEETFVERCKLTLVWLFRQFNEVLERADASKAEIGKLNVTRTDESSFSLSSGVNVDMLIYNFATSRGKDGALKQFLGQYDASMACYKSAILLFEVLLMKMDLPVQDRNLLKNAIHDFTERGKMFEAAS